MTSAAEAAAHAAADGEGGWRLSLLVEGMHCGACVARIEHRLARADGVRNARANLTERRLSVSWEGARERAAELVDAVETLGYRTTPFDTGLLASREDAEARTLLRAMAVSGFAAANIMLLSVSVWAGHAEGMGAATRTLFHWISALIAAPAVAYSGQPFFRSALRSLRAGRMNMDVPISLAVLLALLVSVAETMEGARHAYFDSAVMLLFFLLVGRYLENRARGRARSAASRLLALRAQAVTILADDGAPQRLVAAEIRPGMIALVAAGERIGVDGTIIEGTGSLDLSLITGESLPAPAKPGASVFAGCVNLDAPLRIRVEAAGANTLLAEIARLMEAAEQRRAHYVTLADRLVRIYAPLVHLVALAGFLAWWQFGGATWREALLIAVAVLIITCPCALGLAVPAVQTLTVGRLMRAGLLLKSATALERLATVDRIVFDKTGTLTTGAPTLREDGIDDDDLALAASLAASSRHPLARALTHAAPGARAMAGAREVPGSGITCPGEGGEIRLGNRAWCGVESVHGAQGPELWLVRPGQPPVCFSFEDPLREDASETLERLQAEGFEISILSGDRAETVERIAQQTGITQWRGGVGPGEKLTALENLADSGRRVLMVGDGLNDAPALAAALVSVSPAGAADISQTAADAVFQGARLAPVRELLWMARGSQRLIRQNFALAALYNLCALPLALAGLVTPLIAAAAMSASSLLVVGNALRISRIQVPR